MKRLMILLVLLLVASGAPVGAITKPTALMVTDKSYIDVREYGAKGDGVTDDTAAIQSAIDYIMRAGATDTPALYFTRTPAFYKTTDTLTIKRSPLGSDSFGITIVGDGAQQSRIIYCGDEYEDVILIGSGTDSTYMPAGVVFRDISIMGCENALTETTPARYCIRSDYYFSRFCIIERCMIRNGVGLLSLYGATYATIRDSQFLTSAKIPEYAIASMSDVNGTGSTAGVVYIGGGVGQGNIEVTHNEMSGLGLDPSIGTTTRAVYMRGSGVNFANNSIEACYNRASYTSYSCNLSYVLVVEGVNNMTGLYMEGNDPISAHVMTIGGDTKLTIENGLFSSCGGDAPYIFYNLGPRPIDVQDSYIHSLNSAAITKVSGGKYGGLRNQVRVSNCWAYSGTKYVSADLTRYWDTKTATDSERLGAQDGEVTNFYGLFRNFPKLYSGEYKISSGTDADGLYVKVQAGNFLRSDGGLVSNLWSDSGVTATRTYQLLRFDEDAADRQLLYYRVHIGTCGQPFMTTSATSVASAPYLAADPNWISEFYLDGSDAMSFVATNSLLLYNGQFLGHSGTSAIVQSSGESNPVGVWATGTVCFYYPGSSSPASVGAIVTLCEPGTGSTWLPYAY